MRMIVGYVGAALTLGPLTYPVTLQRCNFWGELIEDTVPITFHNLADLTAFTVRVFKEDPDDGPWLLKN